ncbi:MAG: NAD-dependent DNA ligase LigA, partial [Butyrivibrio sp.]|nr:NAD-dependent DNA ligase LigA [Butyrivibrio sp.]
MDRYYNQDAPEISDYEYDQLMLELKQLEKEHPELVTGDSPTRIIGGNAKRKAGVIVEHDVPMLSIQDVFSKEDVLEWVHEVRAMHPDVKFDVEHKIDGLSMSIRYENGVLKMAETRGDGLLGEDVTANALVIPDIVQKLHTEYPYLEVRGEVYMSHEDFDRTNERQEIQGKKVFANPRNCAAGTLRQLDSAMVRERGLSMFVFNIQKADDMLMQSHYEGLTRLHETEKMTTVPSVLCTTDEEILAQIDAIGEMRGELRYDIDGAVIKIDQIAYRNDFPAGTKYSAGHIAYKYPPEEKEAVITDIELSVGMTGRVNPTAVFTPVRLCGTTVSRATLHNQDFIDKLGIGIGETVVVYKSGEIIPKIRSVV